MTQRHYMTAKGEKLPVGDWYPMPHGPMIAILKNYSPEYEEHAATVMEPDGSKIHYIKGPVVQLLVGMVMLAREQLEGMRTGSLGGRAVQNRSHSLEVVLAVLGGQLSIAPTSHGGCLVRDPTNRFSVHIDGGGKISSVEGAKEDEDHSDAFLFLRQFVVKIGQSPIVDEHLLNQYAWRITAWRLGGDHSLLSHFEAKSWDEVKVLSY